MNKTTRNTVSSIGIAMLFSANAIAYTIGNYDLNKIFYVISFLLISSMTRRITLTMSQVIFFLVTSLFLLSYFISSNEFTVTKAYVFYFLLFYFTAFLACGEELNYRKIYLSLTFMLLLCLPIVIKTQLKPESYDIGLLMGISYSILPLYISSLIVLFNEKRWFYKITSGINFLAFGYFFLTKANRGALFCVILFILLSILYSRNISLKRKYGITAAGTILGLLIYKNLFFILNSLHNILGFFNVNIYALEKSINLLDTNQNFDNGRYFLIDKGLETMEGIKDLIFGKGIGFYENKFDIYIHNVFVQYFIEGGLIYLSLLIYFLVVYFKNYFKVNKNDNLFFTFILTSSLIPLTLSNVYWLTPMYWFSVVFILRNFSNKKNYRIVI